MSRLLPHLPARRPPLILAPMQDITDLPFWRLMHHYGGPDLYFTEYFRVHRDSHPEKHILATLDGNETGKPAIAQMIGQDIPSLIRTAEALQKRNIVGIDLNLGCPAPVVCRKNAGGGLLKHPEQIDAILSALRPVIGCAFTVKSRLGFDSPDEFHAVLDIFEKHEIDAFTIHGRTVREMYRSAVHYDKIRQAVERLRPPVFANGNVLSIRLAEETLELTGAAGLMIGRGAIRNPWLFQQLRDHAEGRATFHPSLRDLRDYIDRLYREVTTPHLTELQQISQMKKYMNFIGQGIGENDEFLQKIRRASTKREFFTLCDDHLLSDAPFPAEPHQAALHCRRSAVMEAEEKAKSNLRCITERP